MNEGIRLHSVSRHCYIVYLRRLRRTGVCMYCMMHVWVRDRNMYNTYNGWYGTLCMYGMVWYGTITYHTYQTYQTNPGVSCIFLVLYG